MAPKVLVLGSSGMAGHVVALYLRETTDFEIIDVGPRRAVFPTTGLCDLGNEVAVRKLVAEVNPKVIINCTGVLVKASEERKREAVWFNAYLPHLLSELCESAGIRLVHVSTDCVFSGLSGPYTEKSHRDGDAFYDRSKALGELDNGRDLTIRTSIIGPELKAAGTGLFDWAMKQRGQVSGYRKALWSGVTTLELARFVRFLVTENTGLSGLVHFSVPGGASKYELLLAIDETFGRGLVVRPSDEPVLDKRLISTREDLGLEASDYRRQLVELRAWIYSHPSLYPAYSETT